ncbi:COesterase domain-containing protein [Meloidogyne graminicola]|uniref:Carboxylic ester hydrolase n=1 Tax=Meloidogyne graminicola TaxID=189291 RepID=A0A8S9ZHQ5_9BILA|nr:COesterase domain-containing protein [Meloidogyne graminicola]
MLIIILFLFLFPQIVLLTEFNDPYLIHTNYGYIRGFPFNINDSNKSKFVKIFLGIPFAQPPINELRFEKPKEPKKWDGIKNTTEMGPACFPHVPKGMMALEEDHNEDCLYMNIATPGWENKNGHHLFPVLFFIHGGGYETGTIREISKEVMANKYSKNNIVFVTFQYRIGQLGFAATGDDDFAGNYGLWDQLRALQFVKDNIEKFGGDPKRITIFGFSAGASSVSALSLSPLSNKLFQQTIQMSGTFFSEWSVSNRVVFETEKMAKIVSCGESLGNSNELKKCLRSKTVKELMDAVEKMGSARKEVNSLLFTPRIDKEFLPNDVLTMLKNAPVKRNLIGITTLETLSFMLLKPEDSLTGLSVLSDEIEKYDRKKFEKFIREKVAPKRIFGKGNGREVQNKIIEFYLCDIEKINEENTEKEVAFYFLEKYIQLTTDLMFIVPMLQEVHYKLEKGWPLYVYMIDYFNKQYYPKNIPIKGAYHAVELAPLFNVTIYPFIIEKFSEEDLKFESVLHTSIVNFVHTGNPSTSALNWPSLKDQPSQYALLNSNPKIVETALFPEKLKFWQELTEKYSFDIVKGIDKETLFTRDEL